MLSDAIIKIENQRKEYKTGTNEYQLCQLIICICHESPEAARVIASSDKTVKDCYKKMYDFASKNRQGNSSGIGTDEAMKIVYEFYNIAGDKPANDVPHTNSSAPAPAPKSSNVVNILDFLD